MSFKPKWERLHDLEKACSNGAKLCLVDLNQLTSLGSLFRIIYQTTDSSSTNVQVLNLSAFNTD